MPSVAAILSILVDAKVGTAIAQLQRLDAAARKAGDGADDAAKRHAAGSKVIQGAAKAGVLAVSGLAAGAVKMASDYEQSLNKLQSVTGATEEQMKSLGKQAIQLGADTKLPGTSAKDAAEAMLEMSKAGLSLKNTQAGVRDVLVLSAAAQISNAKAAEIASNALNAFKLRGQDVRMVTDQLANTANASSVEITDVADSFKMAAAVFNGFQSPVVGAKRAMTDLNTAIGLLGNAGIKGSDAGTSLKQALLALAAPARVTKDLMRNLYLATDGSAEAQRLFTVSLEGTTKKIRDEASNALEKLQGSAKGAGDIAYDAAGKMRSLPEIIDQVTRATKDMTQEERNNAIAKIFGADATRSVLILMQAGQKEWDKMSDSIQRQGAAQDLANAKMKGFRGSMEAFKSTVETLGITFGTTLLPPLTAFLGTLATGLGVLGDHKTATMILIGVIGSLSLAIVTINAATKAWTASVAAWQVVTKAATAVQLAFNATMLANPITLVVVALAALAAALVIAYQKSETFRDIVDGAFDSVRAAARAVGTAVTGSVETITNLPGTVAGLADKAGDAAAKFTRPIINAFHDVKDIIVKVVTWVDNLIDKIGDVIDAIPKIKVPHIDLNPFNGGSGGGNVGPGSDSPPSSVDGFNSVASKFGLMMTSGFRPGDPGYHGLNRARDYSNGTGTAQELAFAHYMAATFGSKLKELIHTPLGYGIKNGQKVPLSFWGSAVNADHYDHVHVALAKGGIVTRPTVALMGESGPEAVIPLTGRNAPGGGDIVINIYGNGRDDQQLAQAVVKEMNRAARRQGSILVPQAV